VTAPVALAPPSKAGAVLAEVSGERPLALVDDRVAGTAWGRSLLPVLGDAARGEVLLLPADPTLGRARAVARRIVEGGNDSVIAVGGGALLDVARLAWFAAGAGIEDVIRHLARGRAGYVMLPVHVPSRVIALPTTLGTGAEASRVVCVITGGRRRLVAAPGFEAKAYVHDPGAYASLGVAEVRSSLLEVALRVIGPYVGSMPDEDTDRAAVAVLADLLAMAPHVLARDPAATSRFAELSCATHSDALLARRAPFSPRLWYLANELSAEAGISKMTAHAALLPAFACRAESGDSRWAVPGRARELVTALRPGCDPARGLVALVGDLLPRDAVAIDVDPHAVASRALSAWGAGLPMLAGLARPDLVAIYAEACTAHRFVPTA
jgi:NADP-dependent alcohol dehydrogenase